MKKAIMIVSTLFLLAQGTVMAAHAGRDRIERGPMGYGRSYDCRSLTANTKLKLTAEQAAQIRALDEKYAQELDLIREQLYDKGRELKSEWLQTEPNRGRIEALRGEVAELRKRMHAPLAAHRAELLKVLTLEQRVHVPDSGPERVFTEPAGLGRR